jgi:hypothetical protein
MMYFFTGYPESAQWWLLQLSVFVKPIHLSSFPVKKQTSMQDSANQISLAIKYYFWNEKEGQETRKISHN